MTAQRALRVALDLLRRRYVAVLMAMLCVQGAFVWTMPLVGALVRRTLHRLGVGGVNADTLDTVASSPVALAVLLGVVIVATVFALADVTVFTVIAHLSLEGEPVTFTGVFARSWRTVRKATGWQGMLLVPYLALLVPISGIGFSSVLTEHIALPKFISGELLKTTTGAVLYGLAMSVMAYAALRLVLFPALVADRDTSVRRALRRSVEMTRWRPLLGFVTVMLSVVVVASLVLTLLVGVGLVPVVLADTYTAAGVTLGLVALTRFLIVGFATAFLAFFFTAYTRLMQGETAATQPEHRSGWRTRAATVSLTALAVLLATPSVFTASDDAVRTATASPEIIGHRGYPAEAVENSVPGLLAADDAGAEVVEVDIQETRDGGLVVMHDVNLSRLTGVDRAIHEMAEAEVTALTLRQNGRTASIPTLEEFVRAADRIGVRLLVELKPHGEEAPGYAGRVSDQLNILDPDRSHMVQSLDRELVREFARLDPERQTAYVVGFQIGDLPRTGAGGAVVIEDWSFHDGMLGEAREKGRGLYVWTVNDLSDQRDYLARGVDGIITDEVDRAVAARERLHAGAVMLYLEQAQGLIGIGLGLE